MPLRYVPIPTAAFTALRAGAPDANGQTPGHIVNILRINPQIHASSASVTIVLSYKKHDANSWVIFDRYAWIISFIYYFFF